MILINENAKVRRDLPATIQEEDEAGRAELQSMALQQVDPDRGDPRVELARLGLVGKPWIYKDHAPLA